MDNNLLFSLHVIVPSSSSHTKYGKQVWLEQSAPTAIWNIVRQMKGKHETEITNPTPLRYSKTLIEVAHSNRQERIMMIPLFLYLPSPKHWSSTQAVLSMVMHTWQGVTEIIDRANFKHGKCHSCLIFIGSHMRGQCDSFPCHCTSWRLQCRPWDRYLPDKDHWLK